MQEVQTKRKEKRNSEVVRGLGDDELVEVELFDTKRERQKSRKRFMRVATVGELVIDLGREFQIFGPRYRTVYCLILVLQNYDL